MDVSYEKNGDFSIKGNLYELGAENFLQAQLVEAARIIEELLDPNDVEVWEALMVVIPYFSTPSQIKELKSYQANRDWINIVYEETRNSH